MVRPYLQLLMRAPRWKKATKAVSSIGGYFVVQDRVELSI